MTTPMEAANRLAQEAGIDIGVGKGDRPSQAILKKYELAEPDDADTPPLRELLDVASAFVKRYVLATPHQLDAVALWTFHTHAFEAAEATPYLQVTSAEKESGKTRLLEVEELLVARPWMTGKTTTAALARKVDKELPTLLLDESDATFKGDKEYAETFRGLLNTGYRLGGRVTVCDGPSVNIGFRDFSTFCPKAIAGIGKLPDTVASRSIPIVLKRRAPHEHVEKFRARSARKDAQPIQEALAKWATSAVDVLKNTIPEVPEELGDRAADVWEPLLAIADMAGGEWPQRARDAARALSGRGVQADDEGLGIGLLGDIRQVFGDRERMLSGALVDALKAMDEAPWGDLWGKPLDARKLARLLKPYDIRSRNFKDGKAVKKDFASIQFEDAWTRYLPSPPDSSATRYYSVTEAAQGPDSIRYPEGEVADDIDPGTAVNPRVAEVADRSGGEGNEGDAEEMTWTR